jgi:hypothetical protein
MAQRVRQAKRALPRAYRRLSIFAAAGVAFGSGVGSGAASNFPSAARSAEGRRLASPVCASASSLAGPAADLWIARSRLRN